MLGLWSLGSTPLALSLHVAFTASLDDVLDACDRLRSRGVTPLSFFGSVTTEPSVIGWMPAAAVYFRDPDGHQLAHLAMLDEEPRPDRGSVPWSQWTRSGMRGPRARRRPRGRPAVVGHRGLIAMGENVVRRPRVAAVAVEEHAGSRTSLRSLFELAEDSPQQLDAYLDAGRVLVALDGDQVVGHLQMTEATRPAEAEIKNMAVDDAAPAPRHRPRVDRGGHRPGSRRMAIHARCRDRSRRHWQSAVLPAARVPDAVDRARRLHHGDRL